MSVIPCKSYSVDYNLKVIDYSILFGLSVFFVFEIKVFHISSSMICRIKSGTYSGTSLEASDQSDSLWNTSGQAARYKQVIFDGYKRSSSFNTINVRVFRSFLCVIHFARITIIIIKKRQLWYVDRNSFAYIKRLFQE
jgi:hypothetical protein